MALSCRIASAMSCLLCGSWLKASSALSLGGRLSPMHISRLLVGVVIAVLLRGNANRGGWLLTGKNTRRPFSYVGLLLSKAMPARRPASAACTTTAKTSSKTMPRRRNGRARRPNRAMPRRRLTSGNGQGVPQDVVLAYMWLSLAATQEPDAARERDLAASQMTSDEITEAQRLAREWKPTTPSP